MDNPTHRPSFQSLFKGGIRRKLLGVIDGGGGLVAKSPPTLAAPQTVTCLAPLSMGFPRQEYWSGLPFSSSVNQLYSKEKKKLHNNSNQKSLGKRIVLN